MMELIGSGPIFHGVALSRDEDRALRKLYGFQSDPRADVLATAGATRNLLRHVQNDGTRVLAFLARFLEAGEDPVAFLAIQLSDIGYDISGDDVEWAQKREKDVESEEELEDDEE